MYLIEINGTTYKEAEHGRFDASLLQGDEEIARTSGDSVLYYSGKLSDVMKWAESYDINRIENGITHDHMISW